MTTPPPPATLRSLYNLTPPAWLSRGRTALLLVDFQREFLDGGLPVPGAAAAIARAHALLSWARAQGLQVVHVRQESPAGSALFAAGSPGAQPAEALTPAAGELVVVKRLAGAFSRTDLDATLRARGADTLLVAGIMTHLAVDTTARDATVLGYRVLVAADACATRPLPGWDGEGVLDADALHRAALCALADRFADVRTCAALAALPVAG
jgi:nicotinamidase-related amidase